MLLALPFLLVFPYVRALNNPNELVRIYTVVAIVENGTYRVDEQVESFGHSEDLARVGGHYVMVKAPGIVHLGVPVYAAFRMFRRYPEPAALAALPEEAAETERLAFTRAATWALRLFASQLPCLAFLIWFERFLRGYSRDFVLRAATVAAVGLGSNYLAYAHMFASHSLYAAAAFLAFGLTLEDPGTRRRAALVGWLVGACVALEYQSLFPVLVLSGYALWRFRRRAGFFVLGGAVHVPLVMWFQHCAYGNAFTPGHKLLENARFAAEHRSGLWGIALPSGKALLALAFSPSCGLFGLSPFLALGIGGLAASLARRDRRAAALAWGGAMLAAIGVNAGFVEWRAGWTVGARYLVVGAPFFGFGALLWLETWRRSWARGVAIGLAFAGIVSVGTVGLLVDTLPDTIGRPFAQFFVPMVRTGHVAHDVGEWLGLRAGPVWYVAIVAALAAPLVLLGRRSLPAAVLAGAVGLAPALASDFALHPSTRFFADVWEPAQKE